MTYEVFAFIPRYNATTTNAVYTISRGGLTTTKSINQNNSFAEWVSLGQHLFDDSGANHVMLTDATGEPVNTKQVGFDAIAFVPHSDATDHGHLACLRAHRQKWQRRAAGDHLALHRHHRPTAALQHGLRNRPAR